MGSEPSRMTADSWGSCLVVATGPAASEVHLPCTSAMALGLLWGQPGRLARAGGTEDGSDLCSCQLVACLNPDMAPLVAASRACASSCYPQGCPVAPALIRELGLQIPTASPVSHRGRCGVGGLAPCWGRDPGPWWAFFPFAFLALWPSQLAWPLPQD